jgi:hypothetical protein
MIRVKQRYWGVIANDGHMQLFDTRAEAERWARHDLQYGGERAVVVRLSPEVVKTIVLSIRDTRR